MYDSGVFGNLAANNSVALNDDQSAVLEDRFDLWVIEISNSHDTHSCICQYDDGDIDFGCDACIWGRYITSNIDDERLVREFLVINGLLKYN